jgi:hypothetical protein
MAEYLESMSNQVKSLNLSEEVVDKFNQLLSNMKAGPKNRPTV